MISQAIRRSCSSGDSIKQMPTSWLSSPDEVTDGESPEKAAWIKMSVSNRGSNNMLSKDLLTKQDIQRQIKAAKNDRDKAFIAVLYETGARIGELIDLKVGDIEDRKHGMKIVIDGKTGARRIPLVESVPHLKR